MNRSNIRKALCLLVALVFLFLSSAVQAQDSSFDPQISSELQLPSLEPQLSSDGLTLSNGYPTLVIVADPNPEMQNIRLRGPQALDALMAPEQALSTFSISYVVAGGQDPWLQVCEEFPAEARQAFEAAAAIWANRIASPVPITISACWASLDSPTTLGYSGGGWMWRDFPNAPLANTWYLSSLANSFAGVDLGPENFDMHITYNANFSWYYGIDANPPLGEFDLVTVAAHEIAHGLNFAGTARYSEGIGSYGSSGFPNIYDTYMEGGDATPLTLYDSPSTALGDLLTSEDLWFGGENASDANGGARVKMYAPAVWAGGSSYSHLDYNTFAGSSESLMVYAIGSGSAYHDPGSMTLGLLKDLGWNLAQDLPHVTLTSPADGATFTAPAQITLAAEASAEIVQVDFYEGDNLLMSDTEAPFEITWSNVPAGTYMLKARAFNAQNSWFDSDPIVVTVNAPSFLSVISPNGGEIILTGSNFTIEWNDQTGAASYLLRYSTDGGASWTPIASVGASTSYNWTVPQVNSTDCLVRVTAYGGAGAFLANDVSNAPFTIEGPVISSLAVLSPNGGETLSAGSNFTIEWNDQTGAASYLLRYSTDGGASWTPIASVGVSTSYNWTVPQVNSTDCLVRVTAYGGAGAFLANDVCNAPFTIVGPVISSLAVLSPNGGETLSAGSNFTIEWNAQTGAASYLLRYSTDGGASWTPIASVGVSTSYNWTVPQVNSTDCLVRVTAYDGAGAFLANDVSNAPFTIEGPVIFSLAVLSPNGGETLSAGSNFTIEWNAQTGAASYLLRYSTDGGASWTPIASVGVSTSYNWTVPQVNSSNCLIRVTAYDGAGAFLANDVSHAPFTIEGEVTSILDGSGTK